MLIVKSPSPPSMSEVFHGSRGFFSLWSEFKSSTSPQKAIVVPVNCVGVMGAGFALQASHELDKGLVEAYKKACGSTLKAQGDVLDLGNVVYFATKGHWNELTNENSLLKGWEKWMATLKPEQERELYLPAIGCGLGGLKWQFLYPRLRLLTPPDIQDSETLKLIFYPT